MIALLAAIALAPLFRDGVVLQQGEPIPVWGTAPAHAKVLISCGPAKTAAFADGQGFWIGYLGPLAPQAAPLELIARVADRPAAAATARGVAVGEVWLGAGPVDPDIAASFARHLETRLDRPVAVVEATSASLNRVLPDAVRGIVWFGGPPGPEEIRAWRAHFGAPDLPLYWAGAAPVNAPELRLPDTGQAVTVDAPDKSEVGRRLALLAKARIYAVPEDDSGPIFVSADREGGSLRLHFRFADNGLIASGRPLQAFEVAGADGQYYPALATIAGDTVIVRSPRVPQPAAVRYGWRDRPEPNLFNGAGLPAAPFSWP